MSLSFNNYGSATTNGTDLGTFGIGANTQLDMGTPATSVSGAAAPNVQVAAPQTPNVGGQTGAAQQGSGFWSKDGGAGMILGGVQVLGNLWSSYQSHKIAKEQMAFAREQWDTNLANQTQTYNTALEDRIRARHAYSGQGEGETQAYLDKHSL